MSNGKLIWITGLAGAGKSTAANYLIGKLKDKHILNAVLIDGDSVREICGNDLGYSLEDRIKNAWRIVKLCKYLCDQGSMDLNIVLYYLLASVFCLFFWPST